MQPFDDLIDLLVRGRVVVLSGAGISTDSGIPDYRGDTDQAMRRAPITYREFVGVPEGRRRYWARSHAGWQHIVRAEPNSAHRVVAMLEEEGALSGVITQNVDGLHRAAGSSNVLELHGSLAFTVCLGCGDRRSRLELHHRLAAANPWWSLGRVNHAPDGDADLAAHLVEGFEIVDCLECGGILKPDVVFFGENVPSERVATAYEWVAGARALLVLGSSLTVMSGYRFVRRAREAGIPIIIINRGPTRGDAEADIRIEAGLTPTLGEIGSRWMQRSREALPNRSTVGGVPAAG